MTEIVELNRTVRDETPTKVCCNQRRLQIDLQEEWSENHTADYGTCCAQGAESGVRDYNICTAP